MEPVYTFTGSVNLDDLHDLRQQTELALKERGLDDESCNSLVLVVDEWVTNIVNHAYKGETGGLEIQVDVDNREASVDIRDRGPAFDITAYQPGEIKHINAPDAKPGGLGIELIRRLTDRLEYSRSEDGWNKSRFTRFI